ncbi:MAG: tetratricopeptide repeat protein [Planctomycetota bacterium]|nr:tetratricopeptide repeat protein [Planctomycetota bacterium]
MTPMTLPQILEIAVTHHRQGRRAQAEQLYLQILAHRPNDPEALHMLGVLAFDVGKLPIALDLINRAIAVNPGKWEYFSNLGLVLINLQRHEEAIAAYRKSLAMNPENISAHHNIGSAFQAMQRFDEAIASYREVLFRQPLNAETCINLAHSLRAKGQYDQAIDAYRKYAALRPEAPDVDLHLGNALTEANRDEEAIEPLTRAVARYPRDPLLHTNLGIALQTVGRTADAITAHSTAAAIQPNEPSYHYNLAISLLHFFRFPEAVAELQRAIDLAPEDPDFQNYMGNALRTIGKYDEAIPYYQKTIELAPHSAIGYNNLANAYKDTGRLDEALAAYDKAIECDPKQAAHHSNRIYLMYFHPEYDAQAILQAHKEWNERHARPLLASADFDQTLANPHRRLRIGYVSPDFREHVVGQNVLPILLHHDRDQFEIFCYASVQSPDDMTRQFQESANHWRNWNNVSDERAAEMVRKDQIDILVDLSLHMAHNRLPVFARKPAPVQVTFAGYPGGTGLPAMDYRLSDPYLDPPEFDQHYVEKTYRLPDSFWCYDPAVVPAASNVEVNPLPAIQNGFVTFGCLNNFCKANGQTLELWLAVLQAVANSHLFVQVPQGTTSRQWAQKLEQAGIEQSRLHFSPYQEQKDYFRLYHHIDIGLDTLPYNGHTTSLDSLWMGVPVVTMLGKTVVGRAGWSQLNNLKLTDLAAHTPAEFVNIAVNLANDLPRLANLRSSLRGRMLQSPLTDAKSFTRNIEVAYRNIWQAWCHSQGRPR